MYSSNPLSYIRRKATFVFALSLVLACLSCSSSEDEDTTIEPPILGYSNSICPDDKHPHAIDLGLPSGTKWACCNVDANTPEDLGGHYAWGETTEKTEYTYDTYLYCAQVEGKQVYAYLGYNIAGSSYDVAHVKMGGSWVMPTQEQLNELRSCEWIWSVRDGKNGTINGYKVKGSNGAMLFFPAASYHWYSSLRKKGYEGGYWSSQPFSTLENIAYILTFTSDNPDNWEVQSKEKGMSVRAVCK